MSKLQCFLVFIVLTFSFSEYCYSQPRVGIRTSLNIASVKFDGSDLLALTKYGAGITLEMDLSNKLFLRPELMYSIKGWKSGDVAMHLHYLNLPVLVGYRPISRLSLLVGPELGYLLDQVTKPSGTFIQDYEHFDYGIALATAYSLTENLAVELRYTYGFDTLVKGTMRDYNNATLAETRDGANRVFQFSVLYFFKARRGIKVVIDR